jgi:hypothetical protein
MASGFLENSGTTTLTGAGGGTTFGNTFIGVTLTASTLATSGIGLPTGSVRWSHMEIIIEDDTANQLNRQCKVFFTWDSEGTAICAGPSAMVSMVAQRPGSTNDYYMAAIDMDMIPSLPSDGTANTIYLWVTTNNFNLSNPVLRKARLYWHDLTKG